MTPKQKILRQAILSTAHHDFEKGLNIHAFFKTSDHEIGQDLVQDTFAKTWGYLVKGGEINTMKAFLYHILNNLIIDQYRKHKTTSLDTLMEKGFDRSTGDQESLFDFLDGKAAITLIARLQDPYGKIIRMRYVQHLSLGEMALITGQTKNTMSVQVHRGLEKLKVLYYLKKR